jgi:uridine kinase
MEKSQISAASLKIADRILSLKPVNAKPLLIAIDGGSGAGKSLIAEIVAKQLKATLIYADDFYAANITNDGWANRSDKERAADVINWRGLRTDVLEPLINGVPARWNSFDFGAGALPDGTYPIKPEFTSYEPNNIIILEGTYSARPELSDLIDLKILVDVPVGIRHERLRKREGKDFLTQWHERWDGAEVYYFRDIRPRTSFDMVIENP